VPGPDGGLTCSPGPCSPSNGPCTVTGDCCNGLQCYVPPGSTQGYCGAPPPPPPGTDAGTLPDGGSCSFYGQSCTQNSDCCDNIPCSLGTGACNGQSGCTCTYPIH